MTNRYFTTLVIIFVLVSVAFFAVRPAASAGLVPWPLIPCGIASQGQAECSRCDIFKLIKNVIDFIFFGLAPVAGTMLFVVAGAYILLAGANIGNVETGKKIMWGTAQALLVIGLAWLLANTFIKATFRSDFQSSATGGAVADKWWQFTCTETTRTPVPVPSTTIPGALPTPVGGSVPADVKAAAQALVSAGVTFASDADCGGSFNASQNIRDMAAGTLPAVCSVSCACGPNGTVVNAALLQGLLALRQAGFSFTVTSFLTGIHGGGSSHYTGNAADISIAPRDPAKWRDARAFLRTQGGTPICEVTVNGVTSDEPNCNFTGTNLTHIHWTR